MVFSSVACVTPVFLFTTVVAISFFLFHYIQQFSQMNLCAKNFVMSQKINVPEHFTSCSFRSQHADKTNNKQEKNNPLAIFSSQLEW